MSRTRVLALLVVLPTGVFSGPRVVKAQLHYLWSDTIAAIDTSFAPSFIRRGQDGRIFVSGIATSSQGSKSLIVECIDSSGAALWRSAFDCGQDPVCSITGLGIDNNGKSYVSASTGINFPGNEALTLSYGFAGNLLWAIRDSAICNHWDMYSVGIELDAVGHVYQAEVTSCDTLMPYQYLMLSKLDENGVLEWRTLWDNPNGEFMWPLSLKLDSFGRLHTTGFAPSNFTPNTYGVIMTNRFDTSGTFRWNEFFGFESPLQQVGYSTACDSAGNVYVVAGVDSINNWQSYGIQAPAVISYDSSGALRGYRKLDGASGWWVQSGSIVVADGQGVLVSSRTAASSGDLCVTALMSFDLETRWCIVEICPSGVAYGHEGGITYGGAEAVYRWQEDNIKGISLSGRIEWESAPGYRARDLLVTGNGEFVACGLATVAGRDAIVVSEYRACACPCLGDPVCDGVRADVLDVVATIGVAFRSNSGYGDAFCPYKSADVDCSGMTDVVDVVKVIDVAFRGVSPQSLVCLTCLP